MNKIIEPSRRGFITGLTSLMVAPAIVRVESIMPVKFVDIYNTRYLVDYNLGTDSLVLRIDRALHALPMPKYVNYISEEHALKYVDKNKILSMRPQEGEQQYLIVNIDNYYGLKL